VLGLPIHDNWWQTETGGIMIANYRAMDIKPGSMGKPLPGIEAASCDATRDEGGVEVVDEPDTEGELALRPAGRRCSAATWHEEERYAKCFADGWYLTGDLAKRDADGYFWFVGRADDVIKSAGHLIGPFEVESALMEHPAVAEAGVIGKPDPVRRRGGQGLRRAQARLLRAERGAAPKELLGHARKRLGPAVAPREIEFRANLPKTRSGKIMRRLLKARELGLPEGDSRPWRARDDDERARCLAARTPAACCCARCCASAASRSAAPSSTAGEDPRLPAPLHRRGGGRVGVMQALTPEDAVVATYREHGHALAAACHDRRSWPRCTASRRAAAAAAAARCTSSTRRPASTAATPSSAAACRWRSGWRWPTRCRARARHRLLLRRGRGGRGRVPRVA
jgi:hypothetical protein